MLYEVITNSFVITFESINYRFQRDIAYQYILDGYDKYWSDLSVNGMAQYTNVSPGTYVLKVRSLRRSDGKIISERTLVLEVVITSYSIHYTKLYDCSVVTQTTRMNVGRCKVMTQRKHRK